VRDDGLPVIQAMRSRYVRQSPFSGVTDNAYVTGDARLAS
jgi:hypothetical protein